MEKYQNRRQAGKQLANRLSAYANRQDVIVLALPRGGVPVAYEIATALNLPLDVFIVRKLGVPGHTELAMGAIAEGGVQVLNDEIIKQLRVEEREIKVIQAKEQQELERRQIAYRGNATFPVVKDKTVIVVDDGIATGATMRAAIKALHTLQTAKIIVAVPVADADMYDQLQGVVDQIICPIKPNYLHAVGAWYEDFSQTEDEEVFMLLEQVKQHG